MRTLFAIAVGAVVLAATSSAQANCQGCSCSSGAQFQQAQGVGAAGTNFVAVASVGCHGRAARNHPLAEARAARLDNRANRASGRAARGVNASCGVASAQLVTLAAAPVQMQAVPVMYQAVPVQTFQAAPVQPQFRLPDPGCQSDPGPQIQLQRRAPAMNQAPAPCLDLN
jgi:hypothetical protein